MSIKAKPQKCAAPNRQKNTLIVSKQSRWMPDQVRHDGFEVAA